MFHATEKIRKDIVTPDGENEFQIRYIRDENVGVLTTRSEKSYLILDSIDYWYDVIQERYPPKQKCRCKNDYFRLFFDYVPRMETVDYRRVELTSCCTQCGKLRKFAQVDIDYSPTVQLFEYPITYCEYPKIKYKLYSVKGYWSKDAFYSLIDFLSQQQVLIYCWYWEWDEKKRHIGRFTAEELKMFLLARDTKLQNTLYSKFLHIYFSREPLEGLFTDSGDYGIDVDRNLWRKREIIQLNSPILVAAKNAGYFYSMDFCSEYMEAGQIRTKSEPFCQLVQKVFAYSQENLK